MNWVKNKLQNKKPYEKIACVFYTYPQSLNSDGYIFGGVIYAYKDNNDLIIYQYNDEISHDYLSLYIKLCRDKHSEGTGNWISVDSLDFYQM